MIDTRFKNELFDPEIPAYLLVIRFTNNAHIISLHPRWRVFNKYYSIQNALFFNIFYYQKQFFFL